MVYNIMTCGGLGYSILGPCSLSWFALAIIFFLALVLRRQCDDGILSGTGFNFIGALVGGLGLGILLVTLTGEPRWTILAGLVGVALGGFGGGLIMDTSGGGE